MSTKASAEARADRHPQFDALMPAAARKEFDIVAAWSVDRLGRSLQHLVGFPRELHAKGVDLYLHQQGIDMTTPAGKALFQMCGVLAEFERAMIVERVQAGLARARLQGKRMGRPRVAQKVEQQIRKARVQGLGMIKMAQKVGCGVSAAQRVSGAEARLCRYSACPRGSSICSSTTGCGLAPARHSDPVR